MRNLLTNEEKVRMDIASDWRHSDIISMCYSKSEHVQRIFKIFRRNRSAKTSSDVIHQCSLCLTLKLVRKEGKCKVRTTIWTLRYIVLQRRHIQFQNKSAAKNKNRKSSQKANKETNVKRVETVAIRVTVIATILPVREKLNFYPRAV